MKKIEELREELNSAEKEAEHAYDSFLESIDGPIYQDEFDSEYNVYKKNYDGSLGRVVVAREKLEEYLWENYFSDNPDEETHVLDMNEGISKIKIQLEKAVILKEESFRKYESAVYRQIDSKDLRSNYFESSCNVRSLEQHLLETIEKYE